MNEEEKKQAVEIAKSNFIEISALLLEPEEEKWEYVTEVDACSMWRRIEGGIQCVRTAAQMDFPPKFIFDFIWDTNNRKSFDEYIRELVVLEKFEEHELEDPVGGLDVLYVNFAMPFPITGRDFVHLRAYRINPDTQEYLTTAKSIPHSKYPEHPSFVRGHIEIDGFMVTPLPNDPNKSIVRYIAKVDPKGSIPNFAVNLANRKVPQTLSAVRKAISAKWGNQA